MKIKEPKYTQCQVCGERALTPMFRHKWSCPNIRKEVKPKPWWQFWK